ncbi:hypothetical protein KWF82_15605 [Acinetobacter baumannii]
MGEISKVGKAVQGGGDLFLALDIYSAGDAIVNAKPEEKTRTTVVETSKIIGGLGGGAIASFIVLGVVTGGTGWVALGIAAGVSWAAGEVSGVAAGAIYDEVDQQMKKRF